MRDIEQTIREVDATMAIEGMPLTEEDKSRLRSILRGEINYDAAIKQIIDKYLSINPVIT
ncbi:MAG: antitoxin VbhA family protein [Clostridiales bacterium]|jgi:citrate lyase gamma subunit|nr:antitoxin VbhA family protein [Clostridiales bacterium]